MGQIQGATTSATTYELSKTPITYVSPIGKVSNKPQTHPIRARTDPGLSQAELGRGTGRQRGSHGQRVTWASVGHMCPCLEGACGCYLCCTCDLSKNHSGKCPESVSGKCPGCPCFKLLTLKRSYPTKLTGTGSAASRQPVRSSFNVGSSRAAAHESPLGSREDPT